MSIRIGEISYTNILPMFYYLDREQLEQNGVTFIPQIPAVLNKKIEEGSIDFSGISSFAYGKNFEKFQLLPNVSVASYGSVGSIFLFSKVPISQLNGKKIALTSSSATSVALLKIILQTFLLLEPSYDVMTPNYHEMMKHHDACLLIGDDAIQMKWNQPSSIYRYDLGDLWYQHTGYPMTYAVFAIRNEVVKDESQLVKNLYEQIITSKNRCIKEQFIPMIQQIETSLGGDRSFWERYFAGLHYDFDQAQQKGLHYYYSLAYDLGLLPKKVTSLHILGSKGEMPFFVS